jgi:hypothetical protein
VPQCDQPQDLDLSLGEIARAGVGGRRGQPRAQLRIEVVLPVRGQADRLDKLHVGGVLDHVPQRARRQRLPRKGGAALHRQDDDLRLRRLGADSRDQLQPRFTRHVEIEHQHIRMMPAHESRGIRGIPRLGDNLEARLGVQEHPQPDPDDRMIIRDDDPHVRRDTGVLLRHLRVTVASQTRPRMRFFRTPMVPAAAKPNRAHPAS